MASARREPIPWIACTRAPRKPGGISARRASSLFGITYSFEMHPVATGPKQARVTRAIGARTVRPDVHVPCHAVEGLLRASTHQPRSPCGAGATVGRSRREALKPYRSRSSELVGAAVALWTPRARLAVEIVGHHHGVGHLVDAG